MRIDVLNSNSVVVDAGAHRGEFSASLKKEVGCHCILIEANPELAACLRESGIGLVLSAALAAKDGDTNFYLEKNLESSSLVRSRTTSTVETIEVETVSLATVLSQAGSNYIDLLKLDIEGAEFAVIEETPADVWKQVGQVTVEFHDFKPEWSERRLFERARATLVQRGFIPALMSFRTHGDVLFLNERKEALNGMQVWYFRHCARFASRMNRNF